MYIKNVDILSEAQKEAVELWWSLESATYDHVDNERYAVKGNTEQEKEYARQADEGCCGSQDVELNCDDGTTLMFGFNYGH